MTANLEGTFRSMLHRAIVDGAMPDEGQIGPLTAAAVEAVANEHPEASPLDISLAYDAFAREHGGPPSRC